MNRIEKIKEIAKVNKDGFTIRLSDFSYVKKGWCVAMKETQNSFGDEGLKKVLSIADETTGIVGGWSENGKFYYDVVIVVESRDEAIRLGKENEQIAIYNLETFEYIRLQ